MSWLPGNVAYMALPVSGGLGSVAALRAIMNVLLPSQHVIGALSGLLLPLFAKCRDSDYFSRLIASLLVCFGAITVAAWVVTSLIAEP
jgi:O-antigen/teichoic acid export membrane protein